MISEPITADRNGSSLLYVAEFSQAVGMVMGAFRLASDAAERWLRERATETGRDVLDLCFDLVQRRVSILDGHLTPPAV